MHTQDVRAGLGGVTPTTFATGYLYAGMGWTTVNEAAVPILSARHTHEELHDTPIVDKSCLVLMANNEIVLDLLEAGELERARHVVAWLIWAAKAYGVKAVNPGGVAAWKWGKDAKTMSGPVEGYTSLTPAKIVAGLARIVDELKLPHPLHLHCNNLGAPGNVATTKLARHMTADDLAAFGERTTLALPPGKTIEQGAATSVLLAASPDVEGVTWRYYEDCAEARQISERGEHTAGVAPYALDLDNAERLWQISGTLTR